MSWKVILQFQRLSLNLHKSLFRSVFEIPNMPYYAVARGRTAGVYHTWGDCEAQVKGFSGARYKKFDSAESAQDFINAEGGSASVPKTNYYHNEPKNFPGTAKYSSKRSYSTSSNNNQSNYSNSTQPKSKSKSKSKRQPSESFDDSDFDSDDSDDLGTIINKQLDDIEKRLSKSGQRIDTIIKKNAKSSGRQTILIEPPQPKRRRSNDDVGFEQDNDGYVQVYTDGACSSNGRQGARAGIGVYWGDGHTLNTSEPVSGRATNNCGEIQAATCAIKQAIQNGVTKLAINTDSQFLINSVTKWMPGWKRKGWKLQSGEPVKNETDFKELDSLQHKLQVKWNYVEAHRGIHGNEMADRLAKDGASKYNK